MVIVLLLQLLLLLLINANLLQLLLHLMTMMIMTVFLCKMCDIYGQAFTIANCRKVDGTHRQL